MEDAGQKLKRVRERLNLRYRDVEEASQRIADRRHNDEFIIALSRLSDIENKGTVPTIFRMYTLCAIYRLEIVEVLQWYGIDLQFLPADAASIPLEKTHAIRFDAELPGEVLLPLQLDPGLDLSRTTYLSRMIQRWGKLPLLLLQNLDLKNQRYAYLGTEDWSMYPLLHPGSLLLIDESRRRIAAGGWTSEFERPIYFVEHREGYVCAWCTPDGDRVILHPHPASRAGVRIFGLDEMDVIGQISGVAMRLDQPANRRHGRGAA